MSLAVKGAKIVQPHYPVVRASSQRSFKSAVSRQQGPAPSDRFKTVTIESSINQLSSTLHPTLYAPIIMTAQRNQPIPQISVAELEQRLKTPSEAVQFVDVREASELELAKLEGFEHLPLSEFAAWSIDIQTRLDREKETIVLCHHGIRSAQMCQWLQTQGFTQVKNVIGGIDAYAIAVDWSIPQY